MQEALFEDKGCPLVEQNILVGLGLVALGWGDEDSLPCPDQGPQLSCLCGVGGCAGLQKRSRKDQDMELSGQHHPIP